MKLSTSHKFILLITALVLSVLASVFCASMPSVKATTITDATNYFSGTSQEITFKNDGVNAKLRKNETFIVNNDLALDSLSFEIKVDNAIKTLKITFKTESYFANGNEISNDGSIEYLDNFENTLTLVFDGANISGTFNQESYTATLADNLNVNFKVENNIVKAYVEGVEVYNDYKSYKVADYGVVGAEDFTFEAVDFNGDNTSSDLLILSIDQDLDDAEHTKKQTFKLNASNQIETIAIPQIALSKDAYAGDGKIYSKQYKQMTFNLTAYSIFGGLEKANLFLAKSEGFDNVWLENVDAPKIVSFNQSGAQKIDVTSNVDGYKKVLETFDVEVYSTDEIAPTYKKDLADAYLLDDTIVNEYSDYLNAVIRATKVKGADGKETFIKNGDNFVVPSLENLVTDNKTAFSKLSQTIYYKTPTTDTTATTGREIPIKSAGDYSFYVTFTDQDNNSIDKDMFYKVDEDDENNIDKGDYYAFVFSFHIEDDSGFSIDTTKTQGTGYVGTLYTATAFSVNATGYSESYKLFYNAKKDATAEDEGWVRIIQEKELTEDYSNEVITADDVKAISYNGQLSFTPNKVGTYKIECEITSDSTARSAKAECFIQVEEPVVVKPYEPLEAREIWAIVFLSVGGACLIGIVALIFVKPKEKTDAEDDE